MQASKIRVNSTMITVEVSAEPAVVSFDDILGRVTIVASDSSVPAPWI